MGALGDMRMLATSRTLVFGSLTIALIAAACSSKGLRNLARQDAGSDGVVMVQDTFQEPQGQDVNPLDVKASIDVIRDQSADMREQVPEARPDVAIDSWVDARDSVDTRNLAPDAPDAPSDSTISDLRRDLPDLGRDAADAADAIPDRPLPGDTNRGDSADALDGESTLELVAGVLGGLGTVDGTGGAARFCWPNGMVYDGQDKLFVADECNHVVRQVVVSSGAVTTLAGVAQQIGLLDGVGPNARFQAPTGITSDGQGNLYVLDSGNHVIRKIVPATGAVSTLAEITEVGGIRKVVGNLWFSGPSAIVHDGQGALYIADDGAIRKLALETGVLTVVAGSSGARGTRDGIGQAAQFAAPEGLALDGVGNLMVADAQNGSIRKIVLATGEVSTLDRTSFTWPQGRMGDGLGGLYVTDNTGHTLSRLVLSTGQVSLVAGSAGKAGSSDGAGPAGRFSCPSGMALDGLGNAFLSDRMNNTLRKVVLGSGVVSTLVGRGGQSGSADGTRETVRFDLSGQSGSSLGLVSDGEGHLYLADPGNQAIRRIVMATGEVTTFAGAPGECELSDGIGKAARFCSPVGIANDGAGSLFVSDSSNHVIRKIDLVTAMVTTIAGSPRTSGSADGVGAAASFNEPQGIAADNQGNLYVADTGNDTIRKIVLATGVVTTLAGSPGMESADDGVGGLAHFWHTSGLVWDGAGSLFVADMWNRTIRKITLAGRVVTTFAGKAQEYGSKDGIGTQALFYGPSGLALDGAGNLFAADTYNQTIRKVALDTAAVTTVVGSPNHPGVILGALPASLASPTALAFVPSVGLFIADSGENVLLRARF
jgi:streptogramin lyase